MLRKPTLLLLSLRLQISWISKHGLSQSFRMVSFDKLDIVLGEDFLNKLKDAAIDLDTVSSP